MEKGETKELMYEIRTNISSNYEIILSCSSSVSGIVDSLNMRHGHIRIFPNTTKFSLNIIALDPGKTVFTLNETNIVDEHGDLNKNIKFDGRYTISEILVYNSRTWHLVAHTLGGIFAVLSFVGFFPEVVWIFWRKSVQGFDKAYLIFETIDSSIYLVYTIGLFYVPTIIAAYENAHRTKVIPVFWFDVVFSVVAMGMCILLLIQYLYYADGNSEVGTSCKVVITAVLLSILGIYLASLAGSISCFSAFMLVPWMRLPIAVIKYIPQIITNYKHEDTSGLCIIMVIAEFLVGFATVVQMIIARYNYNDISLLVGNFSKFFDGLCTLIGNLVFLVQYFYWYKNNRMVDPFFMAWKKFQNLQGTTRNVPIVKTSEEVKCEIKANQTHNIVSYGTM